MPKNIERILEEPSNREGVNNLEKNKKFDLQQEARAKGHLEEARQKKDEGLIRLYEKDVKSDRASMDRTIEKLNLLKQIDREQAGALNEEFDKLVGNVQKKAEELQKAQDEFEAFKNRLNAKVESDPK